MNMISPIARQEITVTLMIEPQTSGRFVASVMEFPDCRVEGATREEAIELVHQRWQEKTAHVEFVATPWVIPVPKVEAAATEAAWMKFAGIFQDDAEFAEIMDELRAERESDDESEVDPAYYLEA